MSYAAALPLAQRAIRAGAWALGQQGVGLVARLASNLLLTRLLAPEVFGSIAVVTVIMIGLTLLSDLGILQNIVVHERGGESRFLNTAWTVQILRGFVVWTGAAVCAAAVHYLAQFGWFKPGTVYADPQLPWIIVVFGFSAVVAGFESTKVQQARRDLQLKQLTMVELASQLVGVVSTLMLVAAFRSIWGLVGGTLVGVLAKMIASHALLPGQSNRLIWDRSAWLDIFSFGKWIFVSSMIGFLVQGGDRIILGALVESRILGLYVIAALLLGAVTVVFQVLVGTVVFSALSEVVRERPWDLRRVYLRFQMQADLLLFALAGFLLTSGPAIVDLLYDPRYSGAGSMLAVLSIGLIGARYAVVEQGFLALKKVRFFATANLCRMAVLCAGLPLGHAVWGIHGALAAIVASQFAGWPIALYFRKKNSLFEWKRELIGIPVFVVGVGFGWSSGVLLRAIERCL